MKTGIKIIGFFTWLIIILGTGYFCVMTNLSDILDAGKMDCHILWQSGRLILKMGKWTETLYVIPAAKERTIVKTKMAAPGKEENKGRW